MHLTVAICTWNRDALLRQTLEQILALRIPAETTWELIVVDNNCTDDTAAVVASFEGRLPIRRVFEPVTGICSARNAATREAAGSYILWTDDDVLVEPDWMEVYRDAFERHPDVAFFGGSILPWFPGAAPQWLLQGFENVASAYASLDYGPAEYAFAPERLPYGANMAVRTAEQRQFLYDVTLGARPGKALRGEETNVFLRMVAAGITGYYLPGAKVRHYIPPARQTTRYLREYYKGLGGYRALTVPMSGPRLFGKPRWVWRQALKHEARYRIGRLVARPEIWTLDLREACVAWGWIEQD